MLQSRSIESHERFSELNIVKKSHLGLSNPMQKSRELYSNERGLNEDDDVIEVHLKQVIRSLYY